MSDLLTERVALVTGAAQGIGLEIARLGAVIEVGGGRLM